MLVEWIDVNLMSNFMRASGGVMMLVAVEWQRLCHQCHRHLGWGAGHWPRLTSSPAPLDWKERGEGGCTLGFVSELLNTSTCRPLYFKGFFSILDNKNWHCQKSPRWFLWGYGMGSCWEKKIWIPERSPRGRDVRESCLLVKGSPFCKTQRWKVAATGYGVSLKVMEIL